jgi:hypothetical protein
VWIISRQEKFYECGVARDNGAGATDLRCWGRPPLVRRSALELGLGNEFPKTRGGPASLGFPLKLPRSARRRPTGENTCSRSRLKALGVHSSVISVGDLANLRQKSPLRLVTQLWDAEIFQNPLPGSKIQAAAVQFLP